MTSIWVEGKEDVELVQALLADLGLDADVKMTGGWTKLRRAEPSLRKVQDAGGRNLIVFDADRPSTGGGAASRRTQIQGTLAGLGLTATVFLFPDDQSDGTVEDLMEDMVPPGHRQVMDCFDDYQTCVGGLTHPVQGSYVVDLAKTRTYAYVRAMPLSAVQEDRRSSYGGTKFFDDPAIWDLRAAQVQALRAFLSAHVI